MVKKKTKEEKAAAKDRPQVPSGVVPGTPGQVLRDEQGRTIGVVDAKGNARMTGREATGTEQLTAEQEQAQAEKSITSTNLIRDLGLTPSIQPQGFTERETPEQQGKPSLFDLLDVQKGLQREGSDIQLAAQPIPLGIGGSGVFKVGKTITNPTRAVQLATALKNSKAVQTIIKTVKASGGKGLSVLGFVTAGATLSDKFLGQKVTAQQQALNTLGQETSAIVGDSISGAGDWRKGLQELDFIERELLILEQDIQKGGIKNFFLKFSGDIIDIKADIQDQLRTIEEGRKDIRTAVLQNAFPEMSEIEIQAQVRSYEQEGLLEPVDLTEARREQ